MNNFRIGSHRHKEQQRGYDGDDSNSDTSSSSSSSSDDDTDSDEEYLESNYFFRRNNRTAKELTFILKHSLKYPPTISKQEFVCSLYYDRMSNNWTKVHEKIYQKILKLLRN